MFATGRNVIGAATLPLNVSERLQSRVCSLSAACRSFSEPKSYSEGGGNVNG